MSSINYIVFDSILAADCLWISTKNMAINGDPSLRYKSTLFKAKQKRGVRIVLNLMLSLYSMVISTSPGVTVVPALM